MVTDSAHDWPPPSTPPLPWPGGSEIAVRSAASEPPETRRSIGRWVAVGTLASAALMASAVTLRWTSPGSCSSGGSAFELMRNRDCLGIVDGSNVLVGGIDYDGWYESFLGPGMTILLAAGLVAVGIVIALRGARKRTLLVGLWLALVSWFTATETAMVDAQLTGSPGLRTWQLASVAAASVLGWASLRSEPGRLSAAGASLGLACVLALVPFAMVEYAIEDKNSFAAGALLVVLTLEGAGVAAGTVIGLEVVRSKPRRPLRLTPAVLTLVLTAVFWGASLIALLD